MKYTNAADILPRELVEEIAKYVDGGLLCRLAEQPLSWLNYQV